jgi:membrane associated rhomboid family serine protease
MVQAPVGWQCRTCVRRNAKSAPVVRYRPGPAGMPSARQVPATMALIAINVALFVAATQSARLTFDSYEIPANIYQGQWDRLFASFFVTNNVSDVGLNMFSLFIIGRLVEPALGKWRFIALYLLAGFGGSVATYLLGTIDVASAGASGAIFGVFGAYFIVARRAALNTSGIISLIAINLVFGFVVPGINWLAHIGGLATGLVVAAGFGLARGRRQEVLADVVVLVVATAVLGALMLLTPGTVNLL